MAVSREKRLWILSTWEYFTNRGLREPTEQIYGTEVVFEDLYGNRIDLIQLDENPPSAKVRYTAGFAKKMITPTVIILDKSNYLGDVNTGVTARNISIYASE